METDRERGPSAPDLARYKRMGDYVLLERIAVGGMGEVWLGKRQGPNGLGELRAVKYLHPRLTEAPEVVSMFVEEARLASRIEHASVARLFELGRDEGTYYIAMEHVFGRDLLAVLRRARDQKVAVPPGLVAFVGQKVAEALDAAFHAPADDGSELHVVHRDVSPQNVVLGFDGRVKLIDFGIARAEAAAHEVDGPFTVRGKLGYMSPEQVAGLPVDHKSDQFSLGICLWELLVLRPLFRRKTDAATIEDVSRARVPKVRSKAPACPVELASVIERMLEKEPSARFADHGEVASALAGVVARLEPAPSRQDVAAFLKKLFEEEYVRDKMRIDALELVGRDLRRGDATPPRGVPAVLAQSSLFDDDDPHEQATTVFPDAGPLAAKMEREILFRRDSLPDSVRDSSPNRGPVHATFRPGRAGATDVWRAPLTDRVEPLASFEAPELAEERDEATFSLEGAFSGLDLDEADLRPPALPAELDLELDQIAEGLGQVQKSQAPSVPPPRGPSTDRILTQKVASIPPPPEPPPAEETPARWPWVLGVIGGGVTLAVVVWALQRFLGP